MADDPQFSSIPAAVEAIRLGKVVIVLDDEGRENEGDFVCAAELATTESINFLMSGRGDFCMPVLPEVCKRLELKPLTEENTTSLGTAFVTPLDHVSAKTGITAEERAKCVREIVHPDSTPEDFVRPGHVHLLTAKEGGVLRRAGHTEAAVDLARMAGLAPAGVLCEVLDETGDRATRDQLFEVAHQHQLEIITIEDLIAYRRVNEKLVSQSSSAKLPTKHGEFQIVVFDVQYENQNPIALVLGNPSESQQPPLVRMHSSCFTGDLINSLRCDCGDQLNMALEMIGSEGVGVLVYLPQEGRGIGLAQKIKAYALQDQGMDTVEANHALGFKADMRDYGIGIQILKDLGLDKIRLLTNNPKKAAAFNLRGFNLSVTDQVPIRASVNEFNADYLAAKRDKMGHVLPEDQSESEESSLKNQH
ncbi:GTP cyclohydrolase II [Mariniblastus sp.]|jgi:3,4-dihydroxy 2-butanone 4-phosphate synthase / GTP cyclohydrolase II|nr:GTP cyclohydrolase II [Mariniblastus sp.]MDB4755909.1 GTP cyclohydrolase II [Mariniblastus sp.]